MPTAPAPTRLPTREEWPDADFDLPDGIPIHAPSDKDDPDEIEDWDLDLDLADTGSRAVVLPVVTRSDAAKAMSSMSASGVVTIRPPLQLPLSDEDDDEGVSTIKATALPFNLAPKPQKLPLPQTIDEDFEDGFVLPSDLTKLSLAPTSLSHRGSKTSLEWGEKDNSSSSQSSDAYSTLGFADNYPSSTSSASLPETETEDDDDELDGLVIPPALFGSKQSGLQLNKILESKKNAERLADPVQLPPPNPEDDFEAGLIIEDDVDLSPSRLLANSQQKPTRIFSRSDSHPPAKASALRPPSRPKLERSKSPSHPPPSSARQLQKMRLSPSPPLRPPSRTQTYQAFAAVPSLPSPTPSPSSSFLSPKPGSLRGQKSHSGLKPPTPPSTARKLTRKASLSVIESTSKQTPRTSLEVPSNHPKSRYEEPTAASRAKTHKSSTTRIHELKVPPTRPSTPSSNPVALRLTMPTQSRLKSRPALSQVFGLPQESKSAATTRAVSPVPPPPRPPSSMSLRSGSRWSKTVPPTAPTPPTAIPKLLRKPKRIRTYGDGTELDGIDDLPLDQDKEGRFRVQPKGFGNRIPGATYDKSLSRSGNKTHDLKGTMRRSGREASLAQDPIPTPLASATNTLRRATTRIEFPKPPPAMDVLPKKKKGVSSPGNTRRKPTLIRNLGGAGGTKVIGDMKWNPTTLRWEGNDQVLRDFDAAMAPTRPALITHLTGSSIGSPAGSFANGARVVGNMYFDPNQMRWISTLPPEEDEPDVFANLADDEEDSDAWENKADTIRASAQSSRISDASSSTTCYAPSNESLNPRSGAGSPTQSHSRTISDSGSDRGSRASMLVSDVDEAFVESCRQAEERHRLEMKGWKTALAKYDPYNGPDRSHLYEIRALATRKY